ncbi:MAG TPA: ThuA domain-containing protein [Acidobacteriota bacterium]|nr:ThuA domain-containing protein [Acidobacteriota bacterium]
MQNRRNAQINLIRKLVFIVAALLTVGAVAAGAETALIRVLVLTGESDLPYHDWRSTTLFLTGLLEKAGRFDVHVEEEVRGLTAPTLARYDVLLLNYNGPRWGDATEKAIEQFVAGGRGMFALHGVSYGQFFGMQFKGTKWIPSTDPGWVAYPDLLGSSWKTENIGHALRGIFTARWIDREHPISRGLDESFLADDELYHKLDLRPTAHVLATAWSDPKNGGTGKDEPVIWTVPFGRGRVVHTIFGHDTASMYQPGFATLFCRSIEWAATGAVTLPRHIEPEPVLRDNAVRVLVVTGGHAYPTAFYTLFEGYDDIRWTHACSQAEAFNPGLTRFEVIVLHDMYEQIGEKERGYLRNYVENGGGIVSTHHAIVDYTSWPWWYEEVVGGKFFTQSDGSHNKSDYKDDVNLVVRRVESASGHPLLRGIGPLAVVDEAYRGMWFSPKMTPIMETESPYNDRPVVYLGPHPKARVVYIQLGHGESTIRHPGYRRLVHNAILWAARRAD